MLELEPERASSGKAAKRPIDGGPDFGLLRSLEAKNILRLEQFLHVRFTAFTSTLY